jgi:hypothetical protein
MSSGIFRISVKTVPEFFRRSSSLSLSSAQLVIASNNALRSSKRSNCTSRCSNPLLVESDCTSSCGKAAQPTALIGEMGCLVNIAPRPTNWNVQPVNLGKRRGQPHLSPGFFS